MENCNPSLETLLKNVDELYELADILNCKTDMSAAKFKESVERDVTESLANKTRGIGGHHVLGSLYPDPLAFTPLRLIITAVVGGKKVVDATKNAIARKKAKEQLIPLYKDIVVKIQAENQQLREEKRRLAELLQEAQQKNVDNQRQIDVLKLRIERGERIIAKYNAVFAKG